MRILMDIDGVLADQVEAALPVINARYGLELTREDIREYDQVIELPDGSTTTFGTEIGPLMHSRAFVVGMRMIEGAVRGVHELGKACSETFLATSRPEAAADATQEWLSRYNLSAYLPLYIDNKAAVPGDILIDDAPHQVEAWAATGRLAIVFDQPWNRGVEEGEFIKRAVGWRQGLARAWDWVKQREREGDVTYLHYSHALRKLNEELDGLLAKYPEEGDDE